LEISRRRHWKIDRNLLFNIVTARPSKLRKKKKNKKKKKNLQRNFFRFPRKICARKCGSRGILKKASRRKKLSLVSLLIVFERLVGGAFWSSAFFSWRFFFFFFFSNSFSSAIMRLLLCLSLIGLCAGALSHYSVLLENGKWVVKEGNHFLTAIATTQWEDTRTVDGWTRLRLKIIKESKVSDELKFFGAGFLEGFVTQRLIFAGVFNFANSSTVAPVTPAMTTLINSQVTWMQQNVKTSGASDPYWYGFCFLSVRCAGST
jgi:hypothetical protein